MPLYDFVCKVCSLEFEQRRSFNESSQATCPNCMGKVSRLFAPVPIVFKGSGFYATDYRRKEQDRSEKGGGIEEAAA